MRGGSCEAKVPVALPSCPTVSDASPPGTNWVPSDDDVGCCTYRTATCCNRYPRVDSRCNVTAAAMECTASSMGFRPRNFSSCHESFECCHHLPPTPPAPPPSPTTWTSTSRSRPSAWAASSPASTRAPSRATRPPLTRSRRASCLPSSRAWASSTPRRTCPIARRAPTSLPPQKDKPSLRSLRSPASPARFALARPLPN